jgi:Holliday junction DNA helicase RuvB
LRDRFGNVLKLDFYSSADLSKIISRNSALLGLEFSPYLVEVISNKSR